ncbi:hypothetical protein [Halomonas saccharevitans]|uniref:Uncharacterized protein n=1 Tax=Halomonas saccharevitans TaxID=416872 RepID=A0A1I7AH34_9GAMM|nr:hypothetical protein [Halomonas saccharevitans]SFT74252.1 hypothetical protein SAMN04487956_11779 [Halomonas saccharevitans]
MIYPDETLDYYADRFVQLRLARHGITLPQYLANIERCERRALEAEPPLPAQQAVILRLWAEQDTGLAMDTTPSVRVEPHRSDDHQDWRELVARWRAEADAAERPVAHLPRRNGAAIEPLRHHRHPRNGAADFARRKIQ